MDVMDQARWLSTDNVDAMMDSLLAGGAAAGPHPGRRRLLLFAAACVRRGWGRLPHEARQAVIAVERSAVGLWAHLARHERASEGWQPYACRTHGAANLLYAAGRPAGPEIGLAATIAASSAACLAGEQWGKGSPRPGQAQAARDIFGDIYAGAGGQPLGHGDEGHGWRTPQVLSLAEAAVGGRRWRGRCPAGCGGIAVAGPQDRGGDFRVGSRGCTGCGGAGTLEGQGFMDPLRLAVLADAMEEAGCAEERLLAHLRGRDWCPRCLGRAGGGPHGWPAGLPCRCKGDGWVDAGPHGLGCWAVDRAMGLDY
jgi:hypothetical protein